MCCEIINFIRIQLPAGPYLRAKFLSENKNTAIEFINCGIIAGGE